MSRFDGPPHALSEALTRMTSVLLSEETLQTVLDLVVEVTCRTLDPADHVSLTVVSVGAYRTASHSDDIVLAIDEAQFGNKEGPTVSAIEDQRLIVSSDLRTDDRWQHIAGVALEHDVASALVVPLAPTDQTIAALSVYSSTTDAFDAEVIETARLLARQAAIALANSQAFAAVSTMNGQLQEALTSRDVIGQAKGILMARDGISADEAFERLKTDSQRTNRKLREIADEIVGGV